jgi:hypothetical protein
MSPAALVLAAAASALILASLAFALARRSARARVATGTMPGYRIESVPGLDALAAIAGPDRPVDRPHSPPEPAESRLLGRVVMASVFLGRDGRAWQPEEIRSVIRALERAVTWLVSEADAWGASVRFEILREVAIGTDASPRRPHALEYGLQENESTLFDAEESSELLRAASVVAARLGFRDFPTLAAVIAARLGADHVVWFLHNLSQGQSHYLDPAHTGVPGLRVAACYAREDEPATHWAGPVFADPATYVHELLHAFGATDKYGGSTRRYPRGEVSSTISCPRTDNRSAQAC